ncbi:MAG: carboxypeptidase-like regulatory domain-containing protein [Armatimonadetes bacterium]|nr:carboxypeptidase-like regulatory domain-containing protein [Armatimonadota bacterium]
MTKQMKHFLGLPAMMLLALTVLQGCGGGHRPRSVVSGTVSDMNQNVIVDAEVYYDGARKTRSLITGIYRLENVPSGWRTIRAKTTINGKTWIGCTAAEILRDEPTMNVNIIIAPVSNTTSIEGIVFDDTNHRVEGARVFLLLQPTGEGQVGPYGSIVAITDRNGHYVLQDVPTGVPAVITASKVGFTNDEVEIANLTPSIDFINFHLIRSNLREGPEAPRLDAIEAYTMPDSITRSENAFDAIRAFTSPRFRAALAKKKPTRIVRSTPLGSLIEIDLYWSDPNNPSRDIAGYGIYRGQSPTVRAIDFVRDPYATFYGDTGVEITPGLKYYYAVASVDVEFLDEFNQPDERAVSELSNLLDVVPLDQLRSISPAQSATISSPPVFKWQALDRADKYSVYVYDRFPTLPLDPDFDYGTDPAVLVGTFPIWHRTVSAPATSMIGPELGPGKYYWVVLAQDNSGTAFSYGDLRPFIVR